ncbi:hypothetical protein ABPG75_013569 [Micractinium tetrahymenae]
MRLACLLLLALAGCATARQERALLQATLPPVCVVSPVPGFLQSVKRVCPPDYPLPIPPIVGGPQTYVTSADGKLCIPRKCPDVPAGEAPWVAVQTTADGVLVCVKCKEPTFTFDPATKLCLQPCVKPFTVPFNPPPKCCAPCPEGTTQLPEKPGCEAKDGTVTEMKCVDRETSQSFVTIKVEPYKRECAPAVCPPAPVLTIPGTPVKCVRCKPPYVAYLDASGNVRPALSTRCCCIIAQPACRLVRRLLSLPTRLDEFCSGISLCLHRPSAARPAPPATCPAAPTASAQLSPP